MSAPQLTTPVLRLLQVGIEETAPLVEVLSALLAVEGLATVPKQVGSLALLRSQSNRTATSFSGSAGVPHGVSTMYERGRWARLETWARQLASVTMSVSPSVRGLK